MKKCLLATVICLCMVVTLLPAMAFATDKKEVVLQIGTEGITGYDSIYYGKWGGQSIKWRVLYTQTNTDTEGLFLMSEDLLDTGNVYYNEKSNSNAWQGSDAQKWCVAFETNNLDERELDAILETDKEDSGLNKDQVFFMSAEEVVNSEYGFTDDKSRKPSQNSAAWWLRSPSSVIENAGYVDGTGIVSQSHVQYKWAARPAFNLDTSKVLFVSQANSEGKKSGSEGEGALKAVVDASDVIRWKLTLKDYDDDAKTTLGHDGFAASLNITSSATVAAGGSVSVNYSGAATGDNEYISAMLTSGSGASGKVLYYGRIVDLSKSGANADGTQSITIPSDLAAGDYTLKIFNEQVHYFDETDYSSKFIDFSITVTDATAPTLTAGAVNRTSDTAATVKFTSNEAGKYYCKVVDSGAPEPAIDSTGTGEACNTTEQTLTPSLTAGAKDIYIVVKDAAGNVSSPLKIAIPAYVSPTITVAKANEGDDTAVYGAAAATKTYTATFTRFTSATDQTVVWCDANGAVTGTPAEAGTDLALSDSSVTFTISVTANAGNYYFKVGAKENDAGKMIYSAPVLFTITQAPQSAPSPITIDFIKEELTGYNKDTMEYSVNAGETYASTLDLAENDSLATLIPASGTRNLFVRLKAKPNYAAGAAQTISIPARPATPEAVATENITVTANSITIKADGNTATNQYLVTLATVETLTGNEAWTDGTGSALNLTSSYAGATPATLTAATQYKVWVRVKAVTDGAPASAANSTTVYTRPATPEAVATENITVTANSITIKADGNTATNQYLVTLATVETLTGNEAWTDGTGSALNLTSSYAGATPAALTAATQYKVWVRVKAVTDGAPASEAASTTVYTLPASSGGSSRTPATPAVPVVVDGEEYNIGKAETSGGVTTVTIDQTELQKQLDSASDAVVIPVTPGKNSDTVVAQFVVANVDEMAEKEMTLSVQVDNVSYDMPAVAVDTKTLMQELGATDPAKVPVNVTIKELDEDDVDLSEGELVLPPVSFTVTASFGGRNADVEVFNNYVQRVIEVPDGTDASSITTAVVVENGKQRHVPTEVFQKDGKWYARINSLTNSVYALINNEKSFADAHGKWFEDVVTEMASRGVIDGRGEGVFDGGANITRAEFAAILVRALGLPENGDATLFTDIDRNAWYYGAVGKAYEYGLVGGRGEGLFDPNAKITRQEAMQMIYNASEIAPIQLLSGINPGLYEDIDSVSDWAKDAAGFSLLNGIVKGNDGLIRPLDNITRGETATIILRLLQKSGLVDVRSKV